MSKPKSWDDIRPVEILDQILREAKVRVTFSINCHCGIAHMISPDHKCGCWRCREQRGEPWDDATEQEAENDSRKAQKLMREWVMSLNRSNKS